MTDKRNNKDWTAALRERLDTSALSPSSDIWSKVESLSGLAVQEGKTDRMPVLAWVTAFCTVAAALALFFIPDLVRNGSLPASGLVAEEYPVSVMPEEGVLVAEASLPAKKAAAPSVQAVVSDENRAAVEAPVNETSLDPDDEAADPAVERQATPAEKTLIHWESPDDYFTEPAAKPKKRVRLALSVAGVSGARESGSDNGTAAVRPNSSDNYGSNLGGNFTSSVETGNDNNEKTKAAESEPDMLSSLPSFRHYRPVSIGLALTYPFSDRWFLESGLNYSYLRADINKAPINVDSRGQELHFLGVPLKLGYVLGASSRFSVALSAGAMAEKLIYGESFGKEIAIKDPQFSVVASAAVQYRIAGRMHLFMAPEFSYYLTETDVPSYHTEHPASLTLRLGVNVSLGSK